MHLVHTATAVTAVQLVDNQITIRYGEVYVNVDIKGEPNRRSINMSD